MNNILSFGKHAGKTFEWLFFNKPSYVEWIFDEGIHHNEYLFSEESANHLLELRKRASCLAGKCESCQERPLRYMGLSFLHGSGTLGHIGFFCEECEYTGGSSTGYYPPSFFAGYPAPRCEQLRITGKIKSYFVGSGRLTQEKMEAFFHNDAHFVHATPGFFTGQLVTA